MNVGVILLTLGGLSLGAATIMDTIFRFRMAGKGHRIGLMKGGNFDYSEYHKVRTKYGWPAWPVYVMWALYVFGIAFLIAGFSMHFGTHPIRSNQHPA